MRTWQSVADVLCVNPGTEGDGKTGERERSFLNDKSVTTFLIFHSPQNQMPPSPCTDSGLRNLNHLLS